MNRQETVGELNRIWREDEFKRGLDLGANEAFASMVVHGHCTVLGRDVQVSFTWPDKRHEEMVRSLSAGHHAACLRGGTAGTAAAGVWPTTTPRRRAAAGRRGRGVSETHEFKPDWCLAPSVALQEWLDETHLSPSVLATACAGRARKDEALALITDVLERKPLTRMHAKVLARGTGVSAQFWLNFEHNYRAGLAAGLTDTSGPSRPVPPDPHHEHHEREQQGAGRRGQHEEDPS